jgi:signal transduction histidine kinase
MRHLVENAERYQAVVQRNLLDLFGVESSADHQVIESASVSTEKSFIVTIYYTGTVYGEYLLAMDESTAAAALGLDTPITESNRPQIQEQIADAFSELLNMVVGECLVDLQSTYAKLTLTPPRVYFGKIRYPKFRTGMSSLKTPFGDIECFFCLDLMRLDLATSYNEAITSLLDVNNKLKEANKHLAEQQAQLVHSEKMASVGILASGVAHEINSPLFFVEANLTALNDYVSIIESIVALYENLCLTVNTTDPELIVAINAIQDERKGKDLEFVLEDTQTLVAESREGVRRIKSIVNGLKEFSHVDIGGVAEADLNLIIRNAISLISHEIEDRCQVEFQCEDIPRVTCNAGEIGQVLINMLMNAAQSLRKDGWIRVKSSCQSTCVTIEIEDNGHGISPEDLDHIFDPFFTTKEVGDGVGLGLSISYGIINKHNGSISVESKVDLGTKFTIRLPVVANVQRHANAIS